MDLFEPIRTWSRARKIRFELYAQSDRQLHDMGMARDQISEIAKAAARRK